MRSRPAALTVRTVCLVVAVTVLGVVGVVVTRPVDAQERRSAGERTADRFAARIMTFTIETTATGELEARNQIELRSKLEQQSTIIEVVPEGTMVLKGDLLVALNSDNIEDQIDEEELRVESARSDLASAESAKSIQETDNEAALKNAKLEGELAELALLQWEHGEFVKKKKQLIVAVDRAKRQHDRLEKKYDRSQGLFEENFLSSDEMELDYISYLEAEANHEIALLDQQTYHEYQEPRDRKSKAADVDNAKTKLKKVTQQNEINLNTKKSTLATRRRQLEMRLRKLEKLNKELAACTMIAPSDGLVVYATSMERSRSMWGGSEGPLQIGRQVRPNELLIVLPDTSEMVASVRVHESLAGRIRPGQTATIRVDAAGGIVYTGTVDSIGVLAESGGWRDPNRREYTVKVLLESDNESGALKPSMRCESTISLGTVADALAVPVQSVFSDGAVRYVYVPKGSKFVRRPIMVGRRSLAYAEILAGLDEDQIVLTREPSPGEVLSTEWDPEELAVAGLTLDQKGQPISAKRRGRGDGHPPTSVGGAPTATIQSGKTTKPASDSGE